MALPIVAIIGQPNVGKSSLLNALAGQMISIVEPVFGQIKEVRGFRRFLLHGLENVTGEWDLICLTHNVLKLFRSGLMSKVA